VADDALDEAFLAKRLRDYHFLMRDALNRNRVTLTADYLHRDNLITCLRLVSRFPQFPPAPSEPNDNRRSF
jgi:hypothetical protein